MRAILLVGFAAAVLATCVSVGCSNGGTTCTYTNTASESQGGSTPRLDACRESGGTCRQGGSVCPSGSHAAPLGSPQGNSCTTSYGYDPVGSPDPCNNNLRMNDRAAPAEMPGTCCLPGDADAGDGGDASDDAPSSIGSCAGEACSAGCSCGILPSDGQPHCFCPEADGGSADAGATPNCGTIYCFAGCSCASVSASSCSCP